jgi:P pilus assembly chaperone PapD
VKRKIVLPLVAMLIATPVWAPQRSGNITVSTTAISFNGSSGNVSSQPLTITSTGQRSVTIQRLSFSKALSLTSRSHCPSH